MTGLSIDRLVRKEVSLGAIRERQPPQDHIGLAQIAPFMDVATDDVIFDYIKGGLQDGLAPARAEDAEAELAQKDEMLYGQGRAAIIDWSLKDKYTASDVTRYREDLLLRQLANGANTDQNFNFAGRTAADFERRVARDDTLRRRKLDNRLEWLIMSSIESGGISYNDGKLMFSVDWGRPSNQTDQVPASGLWDVATNADFDPIGDLLAVQQFMYDTYGFRPKRAITSTKVLNRIWLSTLWQQRAITLVGATLAGQYAGPDQPELLDAGLRSAGGGAGPDRRHGHRVRRVRLGLPDSADRQHHLHEPPLPVGEQDVLPAGTGRPR
jgi:hypothetical protein